MRDAYDNQEMIGDLKPGSEIGIRNPFFLSYRQTRNIPEFVMLICILINLAQFLVKLSFFNQNLAKKSGFFSIINRIIVIYRRVC
jgi:hypothetical protein